MISNSVTGKVPDLKEVFMSIFHLISAVKNSVKQCIWKFLDLNQNSVPLRSVSNNAVSHEVLLYKSIYGEGAQFITGAWHPQIDKSKQDWKDSQS